MFRELARAMEVTASEIMGFSSLDPNLSPSTMNLAKAVPEQYPILSISSEATIEILSNYTPETVKLIAYVDHDTKLVFTVLNLIAKRYTMFADTTWEFIFKLEDIFVTWPNLQIP